MPIYIHCFAYKMEFKNSVLLNYLIHFLLNGNFENNGDWAL